VLELPFIVRLEQHGANQADDDWTPRTFFFPLYSSSPVLLSA